MATNIIVTSAGIQALLNAEQTGTANVVLSRVVFSGTAITASALSQLSDITGIVADIDSVSGVVTDRHTIHVSAGDVSDAAYTARTVGIVTDGGVLFAVASSEDGIISKIATTQAYVSFDMVLTQGNPEYLTFGNTNFLNPDATETMKGVAMLATAEEALEGTERAKTVTPFTLRQTLLDNTDIQFPTGSNYAFDNARDYARGDVVFYQGILYFCLTPNGPASSVVTPGSDSAVWDQIPALSDIVATLSIFDLCPDGAGPHNALYRGKDITADFDSGKFSENVANGTFRDIFPGDYICKDITVNGVTYPAKWVIGDCDYLYKYYSQDAAGAWVPLDTHHCAVFPDIVLGTSYMNSTNITTGGYMGSYMYKTTLPPVRTAIRNLFGSHIVEFWQFLSNTVDANAASRAGSKLVGTVTNNEWVKTVAELMNENMLYGVKWGGSGRDAYDNPHILAAVQHNGQLRHSNVDNSVQNSFWLRDVVSSASFAYANAGGHASNGSASYVRGVRPFCLIR